MRKILIKLFAAIKTLLQDTAYGVSSLKPQVFRFIAWQFHKHLSYPLPLHQTANKTVAFRSPLILMVKVSLHRRSLLVYNGTSSIRLQA